MLSTTRLLATAISKPADVRALSSERRLDDAAMTRTIDDTHNAQSTTQIMLTAVRMGLLVFIDTRTVRQRNQRQRCRHRY